MKEMRSNLSRRAGLAVAGALAAVLCLSALPAKAQDWSMGSTPDRDHLTGLLCFDTYCGFVRLPNTDCVCQKMNPGTTRISEVVLKCSTKEGGQWVACPVPPPYRDAR
jgi:hypothetical protein